MYGLVADQGAARRRHAEEAEFDLGMVQHQGGAPERPEARSQEPGCVREHEATSVEGSALAKRLEGAPRPEDVASVGMDHVASVRVPGEVAALEEDDARAADREADGRGRTGHTAADDGNVVDHPSTVWIEAPDQAAFVRLSFGWRATRTPFVNLTSARTSGSRWAPSSRRHLACAMSRSL